MKLTMLTTSKGGFSSKFNFGQQNSVNNNVYTMFIKSLYNVVKPLYTHFHPQCLNNIKKGPQI